MLCVYRSLYGRKRVGVDVIAVISIFLSSIVRSIYSTEVHHIIHTHSTAVAICVIIIAHVKSWRFVCGAQK